jgi:hypothetical protein
MWQSPHTPVLGYKKEKGDLWVMAVVITNFGINKVLPASTPAVHQYYASR